MNEVGSVTSNAWQRVVAELSAPAPDDRAFMQRLLAVLGQVSGARQGVLWAVGPGGPEEAAEAPDPRMILVWPGEGAKGIEFEAQAKTAARASASHGTIRAFALDKDDPFYDGRSAGHFIALPIGAPAEAGGVSPRTAATLLVDARSGPALQTTLAMVEVLAGYVHTHMARQQLKRTRAAGAALDLAGRLIASINSVRGFKGACLQLTNDISRQMKLDRAALGWVRGHQHSGAVRVVSIADTEHVDRRMAMVQKLEAAMDECMDQEQPVLYPAPPLRGEGGDPLLSNAIVHAHRELASADARLKIASFPLRVDERVIGVLTLESTAEGSIDLPMVELMQAVLDLVSPILALRKSDDRALVIRAKDSTLRSASWLVGPKRTAWKLAGLALLAAAITVTFVKAPYHLEATAILQPDVRRIVSVPYDATIASLSPGIEPGATVNAGDPLCQLDTTELRLAILDVRSQILLAEKEADIALKEAKVHEAQQAQDRAESARARLEFIEERLRRAVIRAPISGRIIAGDLKQKIGASVKLGDSLFEIADLDDVRVILKADDRDAALLRAGMRGTFASKAEPSRRVRFVVDAVVPLAAPVDGANVIEVRATIDANESIPSSFIPGVEGLGKLDAGRRTLLSIGTRRIRDTLTMWFWW